jgi:cytochrome c oxidase assembly protein subunit 15
MSDRLTRSLATIAAVLAFVVVVAGAYVRLSDAGLGCPDWPLCYGQPVPADIAGHDALARAWKEMGHRYLAGTLVLLVFALAYRSWKARRSRGISLAVLALILLQATLGAWTVTQLLEPAIVTAHLLGGMSILGLLTWLALEQGCLSLRARSLRLPGLVALAAVAVQIALGGWVSSNYAALACPDLPLCHGALVPPMDFRNAFHVVRELGHTAEGTLLNNDALTAIHWTHRLSALIVLTLVGWAAYRAFATSRALGSALAVMVMLQFSLGVLNVAVSRPLPLAAAHNAGAAALLVMLVVLNFVAFRRSRSPDFPS